ncbi:MAG: FAD-dependent oxidoreductase [Candidatus Nanopelagicales bacterium]
MSAVDVDVVVVGGGAAGMVAALRAARGGHSVALFEKSTQHGCNTQVSSGSLAAAGTRWQEAAGVQDSPQQQADDIVRESGDESTRPLVEALCAVAPSYLYWLDDDLGHTLELGGDMRRHGMSVPRLHTDPARAGGMALVRTLRSAVAASESIAFVDGTPGVGLLDRDGVVIGAEVLQNGERTAVRSRAVVLASDGFAASAALVAEHVPEAVEDVFQGVSTSTGDALVWATALGAATRNMSSFLGSGMVVPGYATRINPSLPFRGAMLVGLDGRRFVDEHEHGYSSLATVLRALPARRAVLVWDDALHGPSLASELMRESERAGAFRRYDDADALGTALGVDVPALRESLAGFVGWDEVTGERRALQAPYWAAPLTSGILATQGGLEVDTTGRVLRADGTWVENLYAGGGTAMGISGPSSRGYSSGNGLLSALGLGWIIGEHLADAL